MSGIKARINIEDKVRFSQSMLWDLQRKYFEEQGISAWNGQVPFYITSNTFIAKSYANLIARYIQDLVRTGKYDKSEPFYIMELGTGSGQVSFYILRQLQELKHKLGLSDVKTCYVMTDFTNANVSFWQQHKMFQKYIQSGDVDFAVYDLENSQEIELITKKKSLKQGSLKNPLVVIANYIFDTVNHDIFHVENKKIFEAAMNLDGFDDNIENGKPKELKDLETSFSYQNIKPNYYDDKVLDSILQNYAKNIDESSFLFPIGSFKCLDTLRSISNNNLMVISTDKGYAHLEEVEGRSDPRIIFHGSLSMSVNFHAIAEYFAEHGGDSKIQSLREGIKTCLFFAGNKLTELPETALAAEDFVEEFSPADFFHFHRHFRETENYGLKELLSHLILSRWDPYIFSIFIDRIIKEIGDANLAVLHGFLNGMPVLAKNIYPMPGADDHFFSIGLLLHTIHHYHEAIGYYEKSIEFFGEKFANNYNIGLCYYLEDDFENALKYFEKSAPLEDEGKSEGWIKNIKEKLAES